MLTLCMGGGGAVVVISYAVDPNREAVHDTSSAVHENVNWAHLPIAVGILVVSLSGILGSISIMYHGNLAF
jgi:hypothetical protein